MSALKHRFGLVVATEPLRVRCDRVDYLGAGDADVGDVVSFTAEGANASDVRRLDAKPERRRYPTWLKGVVVAVSPSESTIRAVPSLDAFRRTQAITARGGALELGDRVKFQVMANDGRAWNVATQEELLPPDDMREDVGDDAIDDLLAQHDAFDRDPKP